MPASPPPPGWPYRPADIHRIPKFHCACGAPMAYVRVDPLRGEAVRVTPELLSQSVFGCTAVLAGEAQGGPEAHLRVSFDDPAKKGKKKK